MSLDVIHWAEYVTQWTDHKQPFSRTLNCDLSNLLHFLNPTVTFGQRTVTLGLSM